MDRDTQKLANEMQGMFEKWGLFLDTLDGLVAQTVQRGWTTEQARAIVACQVGGASGPGSDEHGQE